MADLIVSGRVSSDIIIGISGIFADLVVVATGIYFLIASIGSAVIILLTIG